MLKDIDALIADFVAVLLPPEEDDDVEVETLQDYILPIEKK